MFTTLKSYQALRDHYARVSETETVGDAIITSSSLGVVVQTEDELTENLQELVTEGALDLIDVEKILGRGYSMGFDSEEMLEDEEDDGIVIHTLTRYYQEYKFKKFGIYLTFPLPEGEAESENWFWNKTFQPARHEELFKKITNRYSFDQLHALACEYRTICMEGFAQALTYFFNSRTDFLRFVDGYRFPYKTFIRDIKAELK